MAQQGAPRAPQASWRARKVRAFMLAVRRSRASLRAEARARLYKAHTAPIRGRVDLGADEALMALYAACTRFGGHG